ncbi:MULTISPECIES: dihydroxyacetone kinase subunit DhaL [unclassified Herbaspirillum]|uniref:dihydroxyacetone kinase subunit DhaL n=1 Tax=unclassified Herbaspirillum TaxID=2624150 RepID=UPI00114EABA0|nr:MULTISPECIES: dihydroxyacetone kinase subunit DhaL [unclassified Herbaspirillum]MBB5393510.1 dihydroxyacetone kinase [Herbaspirillum sp. SJZ102]TQK03742.1 homodimeric dihydroxyacetone kinase [Herbaspirillum sp. SJZ130]TQK08474.1 homodimeric dihydroxyacetone kinase [Herbaspirillum sp. SJZ106]
MKKLINDVAHVVPDMLAGLAALHPHLSLLQGKNIVLRADAREAAARGEVALISGGGAGHEPAHGGYVGAGMLSAAVAGEVFTSPSTDAVLDAIRAVAGPAGVLLIVKNYTGDRLNFGLAAEIARAQGIAVEMVVVADDVALSAHGDHAGRRGLAGTVLVHKIAGAAAARRASLAEVAQAARAAAAALGTMGVALTPCTVPAAGKPGFTLADNEIEWGLGIHGEAGIERGMLVSADEAVARLLRQIADDLKLEHGDRVALLVNNLGGTPASELDIVAGAAMKLLAQRGIRVERAWAGTFLSALEMAGISLTLLRVDEQRLALLDAATPAPAWPSTGGRVAAAADAAMHVAPVPPPSAHTERLSRDAQLRRVIDAVCACLEQAEPVLTDMDQKVGDGDLGISMARAAQSIREEIGDWPSEQDPAAVLRAMSSTVRRVVGGTSGPLYAIMLMRAAASLEQQGRADAAGWAAAFSEAVAGVMELGGARAGDRTMVDALLPAAEAMRSALSSSTDAHAAVAAAATAAAEGASATAAMVPRRGRSSYIGQRALGHPDPGAHAAALWLASVRDALKL